LDGDGEEKRENKKTNSSTPAVPLRAPETGNGHPRQFFGNKGVKEGGERKRIKQGGKK